MKLFRTSIAFVLAVFLMISVLPVVFATESDSVDGVPTSDVSAPPDSEGTAETAAPTQPPAEPTQPEPTPTEPAPTEPAPTEPAPTAPPVVYRVDYSALTLQVAIANGLDEGDYTKESWAQMTEALEIAKSALKSGSQSKVNNATKELKNAIADLVRMDYAALQSALNDVEAFRTEYETLYDLWFNMAQIIPEAQALIGSGDQAAVDAAAAQIDGLLAQMEVQIQELGNPQIVIQEVEVEVPPKTDFCNISLHRVWPVLFFISLAVNGVMVVVIGLLVRRKKNQTDNTPLIDYDIDDDLDVE